MSQKYLRELVDFAQKEIPLLNNDFQNASTLYALQAASQRLFNLTTYMLHHLIHAAYEGGSSPAAPPAPPAPPAPVVAPTPPAPAFVAPSGMPRLPSPSLISQPVPVAATNIPGSPELNIQPGVTNVVITQQGTKVVSADGAITMVAPGEPVGLDATTGRPAVPEAPPGVANVVLPPGGGFTPELAAALASRTGDTPA